MPVLSELYPKDRKGVNEGYLVNIGNAFAKIKLRIFDAIASFNFNQRGVGICISFSSCKRDVFASYVESIISELRCLKGLPVLSLRHGVEKLTDERVARI